MNLTVYTVGHSTHPIDEFIRILKRNGVTAIADVRSQPYSRFNPQFNREALKANLKWRGIAYVFLGRELGARSDDPNCYKNGKVQYERLAKTTLFQEGLARVKSGAEQLKIALMCAEKDPLQCHRTILISRYLAEQGVDVQHILADGQIESHAAALRRLKDQLGMAEQDLFRSAKELEDEAYQRQAERIAYEESRNEEAASVQRQRVAS